MALQRALTAEWDIWKVRNMEQDGTGIPQAEKQLQDRFEKFQFPQIPQNNVYFLLVQKV